MEVTIDDLDLSYPIKHIASLMMEKGALCTKIWGTKMYRIVFRRREYFFSNHANPFVPYIYGILFSSGYFWKQILHYLKIPYASVRPPYVQTVSMLVTRDGFYNALLEKHSFLVGDGKTSMRHLIQKENIKRINNPVKTVLPIRTIHCEATLNKILAKTKIFRLRKSIDYTDVTRSVDSTYIDVCNKILAFLPNLPYVCVTLYTKNISENQTYSLGGCDLAGGMNVFFNASNGRIQYNAGEKILSYNCKHERK